jgi:hypothetical protein
MGEIITKIALVVFGIALYKDGFMSASNALFFTITLLILNLLRDINLRYRQAIRMFPGYGIWFFLAASIICSTNATLKILIGSESWGFTHWNAVVAAGILSMLFRAYMIFCESISRWTTHALGWDNRRIDYALDHMWRTGFISQYFYWNPDYLDGNFDDKENYDEDFEENYDEDFEENYDEYFNYTNEYIQNDSPKCISCCAVQPKR